MPTEPTAPEPAESPNPIAARLGPWDAASIIVGIVVGTAIFKSPQLVFSNSDGPWQAILLWVIGGGLSLVGALCYAELATTYPRSGGDYEYLGRAYGRWLGFLFGWAQLTVILTGSIGAMAYAFADYGASLRPLSPSMTVWLAAAAVVALSLANLAGIVAGKGVQNVLTVAKVVGLLAIIAAGLLFANTGETANQGAAAAAAALREPVGWAGYGLAMVFVLLAYGGWNDAAFVAAEVRDRQRNLPRALFLGILGITLLYGLTNLAYLRALGFEAARTSMAPASDVLQSTAGEWGARGISLLVMISALGAINGMILTGSRVFASLGEDHRLFAWLGRWNRTSSAPIGALIAQAAITLLLIFAVGTVAGRTAVDRIAEALGWQPLPWEKYYGGFDTLVTGTAPVFWAFFLLTGVSVFILRFRDPARPRPFRIPVYPLPPIVFCAACLYMFYSSLAYAGALALLGIIPLALGLPLYAVSRSMRGKG